MIELNSSECDQIGGAGLQSDVLWGAAGGAGSGGAIGAALGVAGGPVGILVGGIVGVGVGFVFGAASAGMASISK